MKRAKKTNKKLDSQETLMLQAVERSAQIEGLSLKAALANAKVIAELKKHGRAFAI